MSVTVDMSCLPKLCMSVSAKTHGMQEQIVRAICLAGDLAYAEEVRQQLGLPQAVLAVNSPDMAAQIAQREAAFLQLALPADAVHFVDSDAAVARLAQLAASTIFAVTALKPRMQS